MRKNIIDLFRNEILKHKERKNEKFHENVTNNPMFFVISRPFRKSEYYHSTNNQSFDSISLIPEIKIDCIDHSRLFDVGRIRMDPNSSLLCQN